MEPVSVIRHLLLLHSPLRATAQARPSPLQFVALIHHTFVYSLAAMPHPWMVPVRANLN